MQRPIRLAAKALFSAVDVIFPDLRGPRILLYHQVGVSLGREIEVSRELFERHLDWMEHNGEIIDLETALESSEVHGADHAYVLTFDDGYSDVFEHAYPLLLSRGVPFTIYLNTHPVESRIPLVPGAEPLTWEQLEQMTRSGLLTVGAHTHRHIDLRGVDEVSAAEELDVCNRLIERRLGQRPLHFAYPWGFWDETAETLVKERYTSAALAFVGDMNRDTDPYRLPRIPIQRSDGFFFLKRKTRTGLRGEVWARRLIRGYEGPTKSNGRLD